MHNHSFLGEGFWQFLCGYGIRLQVDQSMALKQDAIFREVNMDATHVYQF